MSENEHDQTQPVRPAGDQQVPAAAHQEVGPAAEAQPVARRRLRERLSRIRESGRRRTVGLAALVAATVAALVIGAVGGVAVRTAFDGDRGPGQHDDRAGQRFGERSGERLGEDGERRHGGPGRSGPLGQLPPVTPPEDDDQGDSAS